MKSILTSYMKERMERQERKKIQKEPGPVVTISRSFGCPAKIVAQNLCTAVNKKLGLSKTVQHWRWISKEILEESAKELKIDKQMIREASGAEERSVMDDLIMSLSKKFYPGDAKVKKTIRDIVMSFAGDGRVIIVGRAGVSITRDVKNSLHIRLTAPIEWRAEMVSKMQNISLNEAKKKILDVDYKRGKLREFFEGCKPDNSVFDLICNFQTMTEEEILGMIIKVMELRKML
ncbi:AAA family ATPase [Bacteroidota bacterium]